MRRVGRRHPALGQTLPGGIPGQAPGLGGYPDGLAGQTMPGLSSYPGSTVPGGGVNDVEGRLFGYTGPAANCSAVPLLYVIDCR